jgi:RHS repeat-associated protein
MKRTIILLGLLLLSPCAWTQTGFPLYGSFEVSPADAVNRQNLNTVISFPIISNKGRGISLDFSATSNSLIWQNVSSKWIPFPMNQGGGPTWGWNTLNVAGAITFSVSGTEGQCLVAGKEVEEEYMTYSNYVYTEPNGTEHAFGINYTLECGKVEGTKSGYSWDGYYITATTPPTMTVYSPAGIQLTDSVIQDTNGNYVSSTVVNSSETDWTDSAGHLALKVISGSSSISYEYQDTTGTYRTVTLNLGSFNIKTNFACSGVVEYSGTASLPTSISYPNGLTYTFTYETTPGNTGYVTGRLSKVVLPNGGYIQYQYGATNDGVNCADGTITNLTRTIYDGTNTNVWQFSRAASGSNWVTTVTAPQMPYDTAANQSVYTFNSLGQETQEQLYQGSTSGTLLRTINTSWASNGSPATKITILEDNSTQSEIETTYDSFGNLDVSKEHDYGTGAPGAVLRTTNYTYLSTSAYTNLNIMNRVTEKTIADSTGTVQYREDTAYDGTTISPCPTGIVQHNDTNYPCTFTTRGNPTAAITYTNAAAPSGGVTKNSYYDVFGNRVLAAADCCETISWNFSATTEYSSPDSVLKGASSGTHTTTNYTYNSYTGQLASITDPNSQTTSFAYDLMRRPTTTTRPDSAQIVTAYNDTLHTTSTTNPVQGTSEMTQTSYLDGLGRTTKVSVTDASGTLYSTVQTEYDGLDQPYNVSNPYTSSAQYWTETTFDALGRKAKVILPDGEQAAYSYSVASTTVTDPVGNQRKYQSDGLGRLATTYEPDPTNGNSLTLQTSYSYTVLGQLATSTQGSQTRVFSFDGMGRLTSQSLPESGTTSFQYNTYNQISQRTDARGVITTYSYDTMNRPYQISYNVGTSGVSATPTVTYAYGTTASQLNNGRILTLTDGLGTTTYGYDNLGRATQSQYVINGSTYTIGYQYNLAGAVTSLTYPSSRVIQRTYDAIGRLASISDSSTTYANSFSYNAAQLNTNFTYGNGVAATIGYSPDRLQLQSLEFAAGSTPVYNVSYSRTQNGGNNGQITSITDAVDSGRSLTYTYDSLSRLSTALTTGDSNYPQWGLSFAYDRYGNRTNQTVTAGTAVANSVAVSATTNRITTAGYIYDANGNVTNDGSNVLSYDAENRLVSSSGSLGSGTYSYGAFGIRAVKVSGGSTTVSIYDGNHAIAEYTNGALANEYVYLSNQLIASRLSGTLYYHAFDHQSIRVHLNTSGNIVGQKGQFPYGEDWYVSTLTNRHFTTYARDAESANDNALHRFYVNRLARFSSTDSVPGGGANPQGFNLYGYVHNDPVNHLDLDGRHLIDCDAWTGEGCGASGGGGGGGEGPLPNGCVGFLDPTMCGGCDPDSILEGDSCPPPEPVPTPPPPTPTCSAEMFYRPVKHTLRLANHAFWYVQDEIDEDFVIDGGPPEGFSILGILTGRAPLNDWITPGPISSRFEADDISRATPWRAYAQNACYGVEQIEDNAYAWPQNTIRYNILGPNSNSFAHWVGLSAFNPPAPPRTVGWNVNIHF